LATDFTVSPRSPLRLSFFTPPPPPDISTLSLHDALPISSRPSEPSRRRWARLPTVGQSGPSRAVGLRPDVPTAAASPHRTGRRGDRKSTRLNSSHVSISYAVFCLKKKKDPTHTRGDAGTR